MRLIEEVEEILERKVDIDEPLREIIEELTVKWDVEEVKSKNLLVKDQEF